MSRRRRISRRSSKRSFRRSSSRTHRYNVSRPTYRGGIRL